MRIILGALAALLLAGTAYAEPAQVILIRHAEKQPGEPVLSAKGYKRAALLKDFFLEEAAVTQYGAPAAIYAAAPKNEDSSIRSIQTVTPLAKVLGLDIDDSYTRGQTGKLVREIMETPAYDGRMVLVCWQHDNLVKIAYGLAEYNNSPRVNIPLVWDDGSFDRVWILDLKNGRVTAFKDIPQRLLPGDSVK